MAYLTFPPLSEAYSKSAGVGEGYTVGEHTSMVLDRCKAN
ncbi:MAG: hypothetical protein SP1CHLAM54_10570 [Chlamydiia bacterium]|nr:hypothetical protein [Chlamydiia bacterium]MCH9615962.1 hypothetical protein [Chlamydiia bacterium]MCH9628635.1 hypothetical protein [Chlamydiia bacterium]